MSTTDDWLYSDDLDVGLLERDNLGSPDSNVLDGEDLLDDVLTAPSNHRQSSHTPTNDDELLGVVGVKPEDTAMEDSGSARFNAEQLARKVQARIVENRTSHGAESSRGTTIYSREPNRKNSVFIGNLTWWTTDLDVMEAVREAGLTNVVCIKFYENRANGQSKGYALVELSSDTVAQNAAPKLEELTIHNQKLVVMYALKISPHQFETKCNLAKTGVNSSPSTSNLSLSSSSSGSSLGTGRANRGPSSTATAVPTAPPIHPPGLPPGFPPLPPGFPGFPRPPGLPPNDGNNGLGIMGPAPPIPPPGMHGLPPNMPPPFNLLGRPGLPGMGLPPLPPGALGGALEQIKAAGSAPHLNPAFLQEMAAQNAQLGHGNMQKMAELFDRFRQQSTSSSRMGGGMGMGGGGSGGGGSQPSEEEASDANQRNRAISSSAINRALQDANAGDYESAVDMLRMAITLIKQSVTSGTETSQILIQSLQDCLNGIEEQASLTKRSSRREHRGHDERERSRSSHRSSKHHRDRSRERRR